MYINNFFHTTLLLSSSVPRRGWVYLPFSDLIPGIMGKYCKMLEPKFLIMSTYSVFLQLAYISRDSQVWVQDQGDEAQDRCGGGGSIDRQQ